MEINHDDGDRLDKRYIRNLLDALAREGCHGLPYSADSTAPAQLVFDPAPVSEARSLRPAYRLIARARGLDGEVTVRGAILVHASTGINDLASLKGEWISFVSKRSWPGYRLPIALLEKAGIDESSNNFYFVGNHVGAVSALLHRDVHVAVMAEPLARRWAEQNGLSIVAVTDEVEAGGWWLHRDVAEGLANNCIQALTGIGRSRYKALPAWIGSFVTPSTER
ncbi:MAG: PhnD/SsuA/transferrin family substrate-binding protein [Sedimenticola sp.]